jgi:hypothetical protein
MAVATSLSSYNLNLGLLETFIPLSSIITVSVAVGFVLPRHQSFGLYLLVWWWIAVLISLSTTTKTTSITTNINGNDEGAEEPGFLFASPSRWSKGDGRGMFLLLGFCTMTLGILLLWFQTNQRIRGFILSKIPFWCLIALHIYRLDGLSIVMPFYNGYVPKFIGFQTIVLDVWMGATAIPLVLLLICPTLWGSTRRWLGRQKLKEILWLWNSLGLYDLCSAYLIFFLNWARVGGDWITQPPLSRLGYHPFPLLILFQVPLAISIHVLCLTHMDDLMDQQSSGGLPLHVRRIREQKF